MRDPLRTRPPERTLRWAAEAIGPESRVTAVRRMTGGGWHANHAVTVVDASGAAHRLVLRRWARPGWQADDPDFTAQREAAVLQLIAKSPVPAPRLVAADPDAAVCDVPTLLITRLPGTPLRELGDANASLAQLAEALVLIHTVDPTGHPIPEYRTYVQLHSAAPPAWSRRQRLWERALELASEEAPPGPRCFIHRDYHPGNTLWSRGRLVGIVDWTSGSCGPAAVDIGHMRWNLAATYGVAAAEEFPRLCRSAGAATGEDQRYWDLVALLVRHRPCEAAARSGGDAARAVRVTPARRPA